MPSFDDTPEGRYESLMYYGQWTDGDMVSALVSKDEDIAALRSRIATLEGQVKQAREALGLSIKRCQWRGRVDETCSYPFGQTPHCNADAPCWLWGALQALREGGENA